MRVAISALSVKPDQTGGGETVLRNLLPVLPAADPAIEYALFVSGENRHLFAGLPPSFVLHEAPVWALSPGRRVVWEFLWLPRRLKRLRVDLFFAVNQIFAPWMPCRVSALVQNLFYYQYRDFGHRYPLGSLATRSLRHRLYAGLGGVCNRRAAHVVAVSECVREMVVAEDGLPGDKVHVVPLALSSAQRCAAAPEAVARVRDQVGRPFLLYVGALAPYKNIDRALTAMARPEMRERGLALVCIGLDHWGYGHRLRQHSQDLALGDAALFVPALPHGELSAWYAAAEGLVLLSSCEAFPLTPFEAMAQGVPVIASNRSSVPEIVGPAGLVVDPDDAGAVATAFIQVCDDRARCNALVEAGRARIAQFDWVRTADQLVRLWRAEMARDSASI